MVVGRIKRSDKSKWLVMVTGLMGLAKFWEVVMGAANCQVSVIRVAGWGVIHM